MRNLIIAVAVIGGLILAGVGAKYGWDLLRRPVVDAGIDAHMKNGKMDSEMRASFIKGAVSSCVEQRPLSIDEGKFKQYCECVADKGADLVTVEDAKAMNETGKITDSMIAKLQEPIKECLQTAGLKPPQ